MISHTGFWMRKKRSSSKDLNLMLNTTKKENCKANQTAHGIYQVVGRQIETTIHHVIL